MNTLLLALFAYFLANVVVSLIALAQGITIKLNPPTQVYRVISYTIFAIVVLYAWKFWV